MIETSICAKSVDRNSISAGVDVTGHILSFEDRTSCAGIMDSFQSKSDRISTGKYCHVW